MTAAHSNRLNSHCPSARQASLPLPVEQEQQQHQQQQQSTRQGVSKNVRVGHQHAVKALLHPQTVTLPPHLRQLRKRARASESSSVGSARKVSAGRHRHRQHTVPSAPAIHHDYTLDSPHHQAHALRSTAQAVLHALDWVDSQLSCSTGHAQQEDARGGRESSVVADSEATWSGDEGGVLYASIPCPLCEQVGCAAIADSSTLVHRYLHGNMMLVHHPRDALFCLISPALGDQITMTYNQE